MPTPQVKAYLDAHGVAYQTIIYEHAYDAQHVAAAAHVSGKQFAKTVMVKANGTLVMAVVPADTRVDLQQLKVVLAVDHVSLAKEHDFKGLFGDAEVGAMPPFGPLYGVDVYVDEGLTPSEMIAFRAGVHGELIELAYSDFERLAEPHILALAYRR